MLIANLAFFALSCLVLVLSGTWLVKSLTKIACFLRITEFSAAFIIMAIATSLPELFVGISSALEKNPAFSLGNIIGANIIDLTLLVGIFSMIGRGINIKDSKIKKDAFIMCIILILPVILFLIGNSLSRIDGIFLILVFCLYSYWIIKKGKKQKKELGYSVKKGDIFLNVFWDALLTISLFIVCLVVLFFSSNYVVHYANLLAIDLIIPPIMIGLFMISIGTTLPELTFGSRAVLMGHSEMALGDQIGTIIVNSTLIIGITALIFPITANISLFLISGVFMLLVAFLFATFMESGSKLSIREGIALIFLYIFFVILEVYISGLNI